MDENSESIYVDNWMDTLPGLQERAEKLEREAKIQKVAEVAGYALAAAVIHGLTGVLLAYAFKKMREVL